MRILLTNDDGYDAPGISCLYDAIRGLPGVEAVVVVAPKRTQSATSHAITLHRAIAAERRDGAMGGYAVDGRPADCVKLALDPGCGLADGPIDLVVSGTNAGANIGLNVLYSGTVGAAREAAFAGVPAIAVSQFLGDRSQSPWERSGGYAREAVARVLERPIEPGCVMNINVPILDGGREPLGVMPAELCTDHVLGVYEREAAEDGGLSFKAGKTIEYCEPPAGTDVAELFAGWTTVTPLHFDLTHAGEVAALRAAWGR